LNSCFRADWHISLAELDSVPFGETFDKSIFTKSWRAGFFKAVLDSFDQGEERENPEIDAVYRDVLDELLDELGLD
jgi:hypothetical protein